MKHVILASLAAAAMLCAGCASILDRIGEDDIAKLDALAEEWIAKLEAKLAEQPAPETPAPETPADPAPAVDQVDYALLKWLYGGVNAGGAKLDSPRLSGLSCNGRAVSYRWDVGMSGWGLSNGDAGAICAVFFLKDGVWIGAGATILGGVTLHRGCVVAAGAVVNKDVPPDCVVAGIPARLLKELPPLA